MDVHFCIMALSDALQKGPPRVFNTDQGSQFTSREFVGILQDSKIDISMDGKGRALDNVYIERFWRSIKYEEIYLNTYDTYSELIERIDNYITFYNTKRLHQSLNYSTPEDIYNGARKLSD